MSKSICFFRPDSQSIRPRKWLFMSSIFHLRPDWLPSCTPMMTLIMMDITMAKRSIMYDTNESYDSSKVVEVSRAVCWHERNTLVSTSYGCFVLRGGYHTLFMIFVNDLEQKMAWVSYRNLQVSSMGAQN